MDNLNIPTIFTDKDWQAYLDSFLRSAAESSSYTYRNYRLILVQFFSDPHRLPSSYSRADIEAYMHQDCHSSSHQGPPALATVNVRGAVLKSFYRHAADYVVQGEDGNRRLFEGLAPTMGLTLSRKGEKQNYKAMSHEQIQAFFKAIDRTTLCGMRDYALYLSYLFTTRRRIELRNLRWGDIQPAIFRDEHGNERTGYTYQFIGKGRGGVPERLELPQPAYEAIIAYLVGSSRLNTIQPEDPIFIAHGLERNGRGGRRSSTPNAPLHWDSIASNFKQICRRAGLDPSKFSVHSWRHSGIQQRLLAGMSITETMKISGHKSLDIFYRYARRLTTQGDTGAEAMAERFRDL